ncbi:MAG TPA: hypothetical protein DCR61_14120 [Verrucomicrobiales bacterium]|nr:hypothetical protein [Verrucomicrobiales bacterium]HCP39925.1 hypothetical protein [Verrucomicrobiales bacterium]
MIVFHSMLNLVVKLTWFTAGVIPDVNIINLKGNLVHHGICHETVFPAIDRNVLHQRVRSVKIVASSTRR